MPGGDLRDLYRVVERVVSGRPGGLRVTVTAEKDGQALQEKYGNAWLDTCGEKQTESARVPISPGTGPSKTGGGEDGAAGDEHGSRHTETSARTSPVPQPPVRTMPHTMAPTTLEFFIAAEAELGGRAWPPGGEAGAAATAVLDDALEAAETAETSSRDVLVDTEIVGGVENAPLAALWLTPAVEAQPQLTIFHDSFSSIPASSRVASDDDAGSKKEKGETTLQSERHPVDTNSQRKSDAKAKRAKRNLDSALWQVGCFCFGFLGVVVLSRVRAPGRTKETSANARSKPIGEIAEVEPNENKPKSRTFATHSNRRAEVASPRILKEVFSP